LSANATDDDATDDVVPLGWSTASSPRGLEVICERCTRDHVRDIEAKLDETWWT